MIVKHPTLNVEHDVPQRDLERWYAAGWLPLLDDEQQARLEEIELEVDLSHESSEAATAADQGQHSDEGDN